jgi:hypothetical protein
VHGVNTFSNLSVIKPVQGAFYRDSVVLTQVDGAVLLVEDVDYTIFGLDRARTKITANPSGVYNFILINRELAGDVALTYQAFGGEITTADMKAVVAELNNVVQYLGSRAFLTAKDLANTTAMIALHHRLTTLEDRMRILASSGAPTYADSTNGLAVARAITSVDTNFHWWNIAKLYMTEGLTDIFVTDRARYRIQLVGAKLLADVAISLDLTNERDPFAVTTLNILQDLKYTLHGASDPGAVCMPQFRVIYNDELGVLESGVFLQIGLALPALNETIAIEDLSGHESSWIMLPATVNPATNDDDTVTLPDEASIWDSTNPASMAYRHMLPAGPYRAWEGAVAVADLDATVSLVHLLANTFLIEDIKTVTLSFAAQGDNVPFLVQVPMTGLDADNRAGQATIDFGGESVQMGVAFSRALGVLDLKVGPVNPLVGTPAYDLTYVLVTV